MDHNDIPDTIESYWSGTADEITTALLKVMCPKQPGDVAEKYFIDARHRVIRLAMGTADHIGPPVEAPKSRTDLLARLHTDVLKALYPHDKQIQHEIDAFALTRPPIVAGLHLTLSRV